MNQSASLLRALKQAYLNRWILFILIQVVIQWMASVLVSRWLIEKVFYLFDYLLAFMGRNPLLSINFETSLISYLSLILMLWMTIGCLLYPVSLFYWYYLTRDRSLDNVDKGTRESYLLHKQITSDWDRRHAGCIGTLFYLAWDLGRFLLVGQLLALTWLYWVKKTLKTFY